MKNKFTSAFAVVMLGLAFLLGGYSSTYAQTMYQIGTSTSQSTYVPMYYLYDYNYSESIYERTEIVAAGATAAPSRITKISYLPYSTTATTSFQNWEIYMGNTAQSSYSSTGNAITANNMIKVFDGSLPANVTANQWFDLTLNVPFVWDGSSNIVVAVREKSPGWSNTVYFYGTSKSPAKAVYFYQDGNLINPNSPSANSSGTYTIIPNIKLEMQVLPNCTGLPTAGNITGAVNDTIMVCKNTPFSVIDTGATMANQMTYTWQQRTTPTGSWTTITGANSTMYSNASGITTPISYRFIVKCNSSGFSDTTDAVTVALKAVTECYCIPTYTYNCASIAPIHWFGVFGDNSSIRNDNSGCSTPNYGDFTNRTVHVKPFMSYKSYVGSNYGSPTYVNIRGWVDWDDDGVFSASEEVYRRDGAVSSTAPDTFLLTIPGTATPGRHRIRMRSTYSSPAAGSIDPCVSTGYNYGEVEDYTLIVDSIPNCSGQPSAGTVAKSKTFLVCRSEPFSVTVNNATLAYGMTFQWQQRNPSATGNWVNVSVANGGNTLYLNLTGGVTAATDYRFIVTCNSSGLSDTTDYVTAVLDDPTNCYCKANNFYASGSTYHLDEVETYGAPKNIRNVGSGFSPSGYGNFRGDTLVLYRGIKFALRMVAPYSTNYYGAWIDWNRNGTFDGNEMITSSNAYVGAPWSDTITVPTTATLGTTGARFRISYNTSLSPCGNDDYGETEDYTVSIEQPSCQFPAFTSLKLNSVTTTTATISWTAASPSPARGYDYYISTRPNIPQFVTNAVNVSTNSATITGLTPNTRYYVWVRSNCGNDQSIWIQRIYFTTDCLAQDVPYNSPIAAANTPELPSCMKVETLNTNHATWYTASGGAAGFSGQYLKSERSTSGAANNWVFTNLIKLYPGINYKVSFKYGNNSTTTKEKLKVAYGTSQRANSMTNTLFTDNNIGLAGSKDTAVYFTVNTAGEYAVGFQAYSNANQGDLHLQNIVVDSIPICYAATSLLANNITQTSARLTWFGVGDLFRIEYGESGFTRGTGTMVNTTAGTLTVAGLTPNTQYDFYVKNVCVPGLDSAGWSTSGTFTTKCVYPTVNVGNKDIYFCEGDSAVIYTGNTDAVRTVLWSNNSSNDSIIVKNNGLYKLTLTNQYGCVVSDSVLVDVRTYPLVDLGNDTIICDKDKTKFDAGTQPNGATYYWSTAQSTQTIQVKDSGWYKVVVDNLGCISEDSVHLGLYARCSVNGITGKLDPKTGKYNFFAVGAKNVDNYYWDFGDGSNATGIYPEHTYQIPGNYWVKLIVSNQNSSLCGQDTVMTLVNYIDRTGIDDYTDKDALQLYPNPAKDVVTLKNESAYAMEQIVVYNALGQLVYQGKANSAKTHILNTTQFASGIYNVKVTLDNGKWLQRKFEVVK